MSIDAILAVGRKFVERQSTPGRTIVCALTGSHFYGFPAPDSDLDLKAIHVAPTRSVLGLFRPNPTIDAEAPEDQILCDYTSNEAEQALRLLMRGNGNMLERIFSPHQLYDTPELRQLQDLAPAYRSRLAHRHYAGFFRQVCTQHEKDGDRRVKPLLYAYRVALTGVHFLLTGDIVGDVTILAPLYGFPEMSPLVELYQATSEKKTVSPDDDAHHRAVWNRLEAKLTWAHEHSVLPEQPADPGACSEWLIALRCRDFVPR